MKLRNGVLVSLAALACSSPPEAPTEPEPQRVRFDASSVADSTKPNIILILTDDQRADLMAYMPITMNELGGRGVVFENAFHVQGLCCPARASILTGLYPHNHGCFTNQGCAQWLKDSGLDGSSIATALDSTYWTGLIGRYLNGFETVQPAPYRPPGWDVWDPLAKAQNVGGDISVVPTNKAIDFMRSVPPGAPFFLYLGYNAPHAPARAPAADYALFANIAPWSPPSFNEADVSDKPPSVRKVAILTEEQQADIQDFRRQQLASLQGVDRGVGRIVDELQATGKLDNTVIIFAADNGFLWGEHRLRGKSRVYEEVVRMPLIIVAPGASPRTETQLVSVVDLASTVADFAGAAMPDINGMSLRLLIYGSGLGRDAVLLESGGHSGVRTVQYKYVKYNSGAKELYDLTADPYELESKHADPSYAPAMDQLDAVLAGLRTQ